VTEAGSPKLLFENLDLTPIHSILWTDLHRDGPGRPVEYQLEWDLRALMLRRARVLMVAYAVCIAAYRIGRHELRQSVAFFA